ncbi:phage fiber-tail adaptor protein [Gluconobacter cerinus]|uniref:phage fiber-tail adaptor protein n=1 Tax=Gluconobacter cerinus TaxID=38307 RepID=UPI001B8CC4F5|nr:hypothetical protein [Gluconobacter cerinus]MBS1026062.1 hypothetical protein [Gluconobacter cerinus]
MPDNIQCPGVTVASARTLRLLASSTPPLWGVRMPSIRQSWAPKAPADVLEFALDPRRWLEDAGDTLLSVSATVPDPVTSSDLTALWCGKINGLAVVCLAGGQPNTLLPVSLTLHTLQGRRHTEAVTVQINMDSDPDDVPDWPSLEDGTPILPNVLTDPAGRVLTLGPSHVQKVSVAQLLSPDGDSHLTSPADVPLLNQVFRSATDTLLLA